VACPLGWDGMKCDTHAAARHAGIDFGFLNMSLFLFSNSLCR